MSGKNRNTDLVSQWGEVRWNNRLQKRNHTPVDPNSKRSQILYTPERRRQANAARRAYEKRYRFRQIAWIKNWDKNWLSFILSVGEARSELMRLQDSRRENFCRLIVAGGGIGDSYVKAGYSKNDGNASKLYHNIEIQARIQELELEKAEGFIKPIDDILDALNNSKDLELTKAWVLENLMLLTQKAKMDGQANAAFRCIELMGEYLGMWGGKGSGKGAEDATKKRGAKTASRTETGNLANLVTTLRKMDKEQSERDAHAADLAVGAEGDKTVAEESEGLGDGTGTKPEDSEEA